MTSSDNNACAILFDEEPGYILVKPLSHGDQGQVYLVISLGDGKKYVRKHLSPKFRSMKSEIYEKFPSHLVPQLVNISHNDDTGTSLIFEFCNGGDLVHFLSLYKRVQKAPEVFIWSVGKTLIEAVAFAHTGREYYVSSSDSSEVDSDWSWKPIIHGDIAPRNVFLHWPDDMAVIPNILLGDWDTSSKSDKPSQSQALHQDVSSILKILVDLAKANKKSIFASSSDDGPQVQFEKFMHEVEIDDKKYEGPSFATQVAKKFVPLAETTIKQLQLANPADLRRPKSYFDAIFVTFPKSDKERSVELKRWQRTENRRETIRKPWSWIDVVNLPENIRGVLIPSHDMDPVSLENASGKDSKL